MLQSSDWPHHESDIHLAGVGPPDVGAPDCRVCEMGADTGGRSLDQTAVVRQHLLLLLLWHLSHLSQYIL